MGFTSWLCNLKSACDLSRAGRTRQPLRRKPESRFRPRLEVLEDRTVPSTFKVNSFLDTVAVNPAVSALDAAGNITLRSAIMAANATPGADHIHLPAGIYTRSLAGAGEDHAASGDLDITGELK